jgi:hypothetical protein
MSLMKNGQFRHDQQRFNKASQEKISSSKETNNPKFETPKDAPLDQQYRKKVISGYLTCGCQTSRLAPTYYLVHITTCQCNLLVRWTFVLLVWKIYTLFSISNEQTNIAGIKNTYHWAFWQKTRCHLAVISLIIILCFSNCHFKWAIYRKSCVDIYCLNPSRFCSYYIQVSEGLLHCHSKNFNLFATRYHIVRSPELRK